jgi:hypothetical protein
MSKPDLGVLDPNEIYLANEIATRIKPPPRATMRSVPPPAAVPVWLAGSRVATAVARAGTIPREVPSEPALEPELDEVPRAGVGRMAQRMSRGIQARANRWIVASYKLVGFAVLTAVVVALVAYLGANVFYWFSTSWVVPTVISPTDERVLQLKSKMAEEATARDRIVADLADADRVIAMHADYLENARKALIEELADKKSELEQLAELGKDLAETRSELHTNSRAYADMSRKRLSAEYDAHLIDREAAVSGALQLSQLAQGNLNVAERAVALGKRRAELMRETEALAGLVSKQPSRRHSLEVLRILQELKRSQLELAKAGDNRQVLQNSLDRYEEIVRTIADSPYLLAVAQRSAIAFAPYENLPAIKPGTPLYACSYGLLVCRSVGRVAAVLAGEVAVKHPVHNSVLRGQSLQLELTDARAAEQKTLFVGGRPLLF